MLILKHVLLDLHGPNDYCLPLKVNTLNESIQAQPTPISPKIKPPSPHMVGGKYMVHMDTPAMIGWIVNGRVH